MKVTRDKAFERLCKPEKGKVSGRLMFIRKRHTESTIELELQLAYNFTSSYLRMKPDHLHTLSRLVTITDTSLTVGSHIAGGV